LRGGNLWPEQRRGQYSSCRSEKKRRRGSNGQNSGAEKKKKKAGVQRRGSRTFTTPKKKKKKKKKNKTPQNSNLWRRGRAPQKGKSSGKAQALAIKLSRIRKDSLGSGSSRKKGVQITKEGASSRDCQESGNEEKKENVSRVNKRRFWEKRPRY